MESGMTDAAFYGIINPVRGWRLPNKPSNSTGDTLKGVIRDMASNGYNGNGYDKTGMNEGGFRAGGFNRGYFDGDGSNRREGREYSNRTDSFDRRNGGGYRDNDYRERQQRRDNGYRDERRYESKANRNIMNVDIDHEAERNALRREYIEDHGFAPNSVAAFALTHPSSVEYFESPENGELLIRIKEWNGRRGYTCAVKDAADRFVIGFDATIRLIKDWETMRVEITRTFPDTPIHWLDIYDHMLDLRDEYKEKHGYESNTVAAMVDADPDRVTEFTNEDGIECYRITFFNGKEFVCAKERATIKQIRGYDALFDKLGDYVRDREVDLREKRAEAIRCIRENAAKAMASDDADDTNEDDTVDTEAM